MAPSCREARGPLGPRPRPSGPERSGPGRKQQAGLPGPGPALLHRARGSERAGGPGGRRAAGQRGGGAQVWRLRGPGPPASTDGHAGGAPSCAVRRRAHPKPRGAAPPRAALRPRAAGPRAPAVAAEERRAAPSVRLREPRSCTPPPGPGSHPPPGRRGRGRRGLPAPAPQTWPGRKHRAAHLALGSSPGGPLSSRRSGTPQHRGARAETPPPARSLRMCEGGWAGPAAGSGR